MVIVYIICFYVCIYTLYTYVVCNVVVDAMLTTRAGVGPLALTKDKYTGSVNFDIRSKISHSVTANVNILHTPIGDCDSCANKTHINITIIKSIAR